MDCSTCRTLLEIPNGPLDAEKIYQAFKQKALRNMDIRNLDEMSELVRARDWLLGLLRTSDIGVLVEG